MRCPSLVTGWTVLWLSIGVLLGGCSRTELAPAPDVTDAGPQLFEHGPGVVVSAGSPGAPDPTSKGPLWWLVARDAKLDVYNGLPHQQLVRVVAVALVPCRTPARLAVLLPNGRARTVDVSPGAAGTVVRFAVRVPSRDAVEVPVRVSATACHPPNDGRTLYAGFRNLQARAAGSRG